MCTNNLGEAEILSIDLCICTHLFPDVLLASDTGKPGVQMSVVN